MITFLLISGLILSIGLNIALFILLKIQLSKISTYESWVIDFKMDLANTLEKMRKIDDDATFKSSFTTSDEGTFESDDEVGQTFKELLSLVEKLNQRIQ